MKTLLSLSISLLLATSFAFAQDTRILAGKIGKHAGTPVDGTSEVQTLTIGGTPTEGTFTLVFAGRTSGAITWTDTDATLVSNIDAALEAMPTIGTGGVTTAAGTVSSGIGTVTLTFAGNLAKLAVGTVTVGSNDLEGTAPTLAVAETTPGVSSTARGSEKGALLTDTTNGVLYINEGTPTNINWEAFATP